MKVWTFALCLAFLGLDFLSKSLALEYLPPIRWHSVYPFNGIGVFAFGGVTFSLNFVTNTGAAWGLFSGQAGYLFLIRVAVISALAFFLLFFNKGKFPAFPLWLILTGALGNALDYYLYGQVIDFFHFTFWGHSFPVFNCADSYITLGALSLFFITRSKREAALG